MAIAARCRLTSIISALCSHMTLLASETIQFKTIEPPIDTLLLLGPSMIIGTLFRFSANVKKNLHIKLDADFNEENKIKRYVPLERIFCIGNASFILVHVNANFLSYTITASRFSFSRLSTPKSIDNRKKSVFHFNTSHL